MKRRVVNVGGLAGTQPQDQRLKRPLLYQLSYHPKRNRSGNITDCGASEDRRNVRESPVRRKEFPDHAHDARSKPKSLITVNITKLRRICRQSFVLVWVSCRGKRLCPAGFLCVPSKLTAQRPSAIPSAA